jgi:hypothetical protein
VQGEDIWWFEQYSWALFKVQYEENNREYRETVLDKSRKVPEVSVTQQTV